MKNIILIVTFILNLYAQSMEVPKWLLIDPDNDGKYFRGTSSWYDTNSSGIKLLAERDALENAYSYIYKHFDINESTDQFTLKLKPLKSYVETSNDKEKSRKHLLLLLDEESEKDINSTLRDRKEYRELKEKIIDSIEDRHYFKARNYLKLAKGKNSATLDDTIDEIEKRLNRLIKELLQVKININKRSYFPDESIELEAFLNKDGYLYLFYETAIDVEMIFPNEHQQDSYLNKDQLISFPNDAVKEITAYAEDLGKKVRFYGIASKKHLNLKSLSLERDEGIYRYEKTGNYIKLIQECIDQGECTKTIINFEISHTAKSAPVVLEFNSDDINKKDMIKYFKSKGIVSKKSSRKIEFYVKKINRYSNKPELTLRTFHITSYLYNKETLVKTLETECSKEEVNKYMLEMYDELQKV